MKIIQANKYYFLKGGAERYMLELSDWLNDHGHDVIPFSMSHPDNLLTSYEKYFVSNVLTAESEFSPPHKGRSTLSSRSKRRLGGVFSRFKTFGRMFYSFEARRNLATLIAHTKPDLCHVHNIYTQISPSIFHTLKDQHIPVVMTVHDHHLISPQYNIRAIGCGEDYRNVGLLRGTFSRFHKNSLLASFAQTAVYKFHRWLKIYERGVDLFICPSQYMRRQLIRGGFPDEKIRVNPFGIDCDLIQPRYDHEGYFLFVGRLSEEKGIETIIRAAKMIGNVQLKIVGRGPDMDRLHRIADSTPSIQFLGFRDGEELRKLYRGACAVLLPSMVNENFPLSALEAMSAGKPVIASDVGGVGEIVEDRINGILVAPTDLQGWVEAILRIMYDDQLRIAMGHASRVSVEYKFRSEDHYRRLMCIYKEVVMK